MGGDSGHILNSARHLGFEDLHSSSSSMPQLGTWRTSKGERAGCARLSLRVAAAAAALALGSRAR